jgi:hypothetical protein
MSSKRLDYLSWRETHFIVEDKLHKSKVEQARIVELKSSMNSNRNYFTWDHLTELNE